MDKTDVESIATDANTKPITPTSIESIDTDTNTKSMTPTDVMNYHKNKNAIINKMRDQYFEKYDVVSIVNDVLKENCDELVTSGEIAISEIYIARKLYYKYDDLYSDYYNYIDKCYGYPKYPNTNESDKYVFECLLNFESLFKKNGWNVTHKYTTDTYYPFNPTKLKQFIFKPTTDLNCPNNDENDMVEL